MNFHCLDYRSHRPLLPNRCISLNCSCTSDDSIDHAPTPSLQRPYVSVQRPPGITSHMICTCFECKINKKMIAKKRCLFPYDKLKSLSPSYTHKFSTANKKHPSIEHSHVDCTMCTLYSTPNNVMKNSVLNKDSCIVKKTEEREDVKLSTMRYHQLHYERMLDINLNERYWKTLRELKEKHRFSRTANGNRKIEIQPYGLSKGTLKKSTKEIEQDKNISAPLGYIKEEASFGHPNHGKLKYVVKQKFEPRQKRRFQCLYCEKSFGKSSHLRDHHRTHSGERPFGCRYCGKAFSQFSNLRTHLRIHTGEKPFKCHICEKSFTQRVTLRSHLRTHNPKNTSNKNM